VEQFGTECFILPDHDNLPKKQNHPEEYMVRKGYRSSIQLRTWKENQNFLEPEKRIVTSILR